MVSTEVKLTVIFDNYDFNPDLQTGWGFSCLVETIGESVLFDTGADGAILLGNMRKLDIQPENIDHIVLSHIHLDHTGGISDFLSRDDNVKVYIPKSFPEDFRALITDNGVEYIDVDGFARIENGIFTTGEVKGRINEQSLIIDTDEGIIVVTGCAHPGIVQILKGVKKATGKDLYMVLGGFHLKGENDASLKSIISELRSLGVQKIGPCHCSGDRCRELFKEEYGEDYIEVGVGTFLRA